MPEENLSIPKGFTKLEHFGHVTQQTILPIVAMSRNKITPLGTGFIIAPWGLLVTAKHVVDKEASAWLDLNNSADPTYLYAIYVSDTKHGENTENYLGGPIKILNVSFNPEYDIAYCLLERFSLKGKLFDYPCVKLNLEPPRVEENILGFGYYKSVAEYISNDDISSLTEISYDQNTAFTTGNVVMHHFPKRDTALLNFPCFETNARFEPGMSGGPIFNEAGSVCGVICSSVSGLSDKEGYISYASMLWPTLAVTIPIADSQGKTVATTIYDLIKENHISIKNLEKFSLIHLENGKVTVSYRPVKD